MKKFTKEKIRFARMSQRISQNLCFKFSTIKNGKINFAFDPAAKPDTLKQNQPQKGGVLIYLFKLKIYEFYVFMKTLLKT